MPKRPFTTEHPFQAELWSKLSKRVVSQCCSLSCIVQGQCPRVAAPLCSVGCGIEAMREFVNRDLAEASCSMSCVPSYGTSHTTQRHDDLFQVRAQLLLCDPRCCLHTGIFESTNSVIRRLSASVMLCDLASRHLHAHIGLGFRTMSKRDAQALNYFHIGAAMTFEASELEACVNTIKQHGAQ